MICTLRDKEILQTLSRFGVLSTDQVGRKHFPNTAQTTVRRRLRTFEKYDLIYRVKGLDHGGVAWALSKNAVQSMGFSNAQIKHFNRNTRNNDVVLSEVRNVLEGAGRLGNGKNLSTCTSSYFFKKIGHGP